MAWEEAVRDQAIDSRLAAANAGDGAARGHDVAGLLRRIAALESDNAELLRSNADLLEFASVAAHELRSPLQTITGFAELLAAEVGTSLGGEGQEYLDGMRRSASRLQGLVDGLLVYARVGTTVRRREDVDCDELAAEACESLARRMAAAGATVAWASLPTVVGDPTELTLVFRNLISNAVKYRKPDLPATVHLSACQVDGKWQIQVDDNGVGIDERHRERVFRVFQRLPGQEANAGTGIGLAVCKRIVEGHGGRIWVEGNDEGGTRVCFTLPIPVCWSPF